MSKHKSFATNAVSCGTWSRVRLTNNGTTTNSSISPQMFKRECEEYDNGTLPNEHELYMGERYGVSVVS